MVSIHYLYLMEKIYNKLCLLFFVVFAMAGASCGSSQGDLPCIDVHKNYPEKEILITDIAEVSYLHLNSDDDAYLYKGGINSITKNTVVVYDNASGSVLFFSKDGSPKSRFNRRGRGGEEYLGSLRVIYDELADEVFVVNFGSDSFSDFIQVYSSTGKHKRKIVLQDLDIGSVISFDEQSLLVYDSRFETMRNMEKLGITSFSIEYDHSPFFLISKTDGSILDYIEVPHKDIMLSINNNNTSWFPPRRVTKSPGGVYLCNPETDTVFHYGKDKILRPVICKTPLVDALDPMVILNNCIDAGGYQFLELISLIKEDRKRLSEYFIRDKTTGEIFRQKLILPEYKGKEFFSGLFRVNIDYENGTYFVLDLLELKQAYTENRLSGKLKDLVATLKEDDNDVYVMLQFK